jgi:hypothetical protein
MSETPKMRRRRAAAARVPFPGVLDAITDDVESELAAVEVSAEPPADDEPVRDALESRLRGLGAATTALGRSGRRSSADGERD